MPASELSVRSIRAVAATSSLEQLRRAIAAVFRIGACQSAVFLLGIPDLFGSRIELPERIRCFDATMLRRMLANPMWPEVRTQILQPKPHQRVRQLVVAVLGDAGNR